MYYKYLLLIFMPFLFSISDVSISSRRTTCTTRTIYLTFDDEPGDGSRNINSVINEERVAANVFIQGIYVSSLRTGLVDYIQYKNNLFIECSNGSFSMSDISTKYYRYPTYIFTQYSYNEDFLNLGNWICRIPGRNMWRLHYRYSNKGLTGSIPADILAIYGYTIVGWDIEWKDKNRCKEAQSAQDVFKSMEKAFNKNKTFTTGHLVLLCHDRLFADAKGKQQLKLLIEKLKDNGKYRFDWLSTYPGQ